MGKKKKRKYPQSTPLWRFLFVVYAGVLLWLLFDRPIARDPGVSYGDLLRGNMNLIPFHTIRNYARVVARWDFTPIFRHCVINLCGNVFLFIPIGYFFPRLWPSLRNFWTFLILCTLAIILVELLQLVTLLGCLDVDDLILNLLGMILGYILFIIIKK